MRLQDLLDDLAEAFPTTIREGNPPALWRIVEVARRVAALFQTCGDCDGGRLHFHHDCAEGKPWQQGRGCENPQCFPHGGSAPCSHCGGTGLAVTEESMKLAVGQTTYKGRTEPLIGWLPLARFLFADGSQEGEGR